MIGFIAMIAPMKLASAVENLPATLLSAAATRID
jgi:hypothetical protein